MMSLSSARPPSSFGYDHFRSEFAKSLPKFPSLKLHSDVLQILSGNASVGDILRFWRERFGSLQELRCRDVSVVAVVALVITGMPLRSPSLREDRVVFNMKET